MYSVTTIKIAIVKIKLSVKLINIIPDDKSREVSLLEAI